MATDVKTALTEAWAEVADGPALVVLRNGGECRIHVGASAPAKETDDYFLMTNYFSYPGTEKTFARVAVVSGSSAVIVNTPIV